jgi:hypothetical protein
MMERLDGFSPEVNVLHVSQVYISASNEGIIEG